MEALFPRYPTRRSRNQKGLSLVPNRKRRSTFPEAIASGFRSGAGARERTERVCHLRMRVENAPRGVP